MSHHIERLRATIQELEAELQRLEQVDPHTRQVLRDAVDEIEAALEDEQPQQRKSRPLSQRLLEHVETVEVSHPTLATVVTRMAEALGQLGI